MTTTQTTVRTHPKSSLQTGKWVKLGLATAVISVIAVLIVQAVILAVRPDLALFKPLDNFARSALFTAVPALIATALFAWLAKNRTNPVPTFLWISAVVLVLSLIPDFALPIENKTIQGSAAAAFLHLVAGTATAFILIKGYQRLKQSKA